MKNHIRSLDRALCLFFVTLMLWLTICRLFESAEQALRVSFVDIATNVGLIDRFICGGDKQKLYLIETLGGGVALFDYDNDGYLDVFFVTGSTLEGFPRGKEPTNHLYRNRRDGSFTDVTSRAGLSRGGWGQGVCVGDYDNDGYEDLFVTYYGDNVLYYNNRNGTFTDVTEKAGLLGTKKRWSTGCAFVDYDRDGKLDLFVADYIEFDLQTTPKPGEGPFCYWKGYPVACGPRGLKGGTNQLFRNNGDGSFTDVSIASRVAESGDRYSLSVTTLDFNRDGWPDIYVAVDSQPSILYQNNGDGTFSDVAMTAGVALSKDGRAQAGMGSAAGDFDRDGYPDIIKTNFIDDTPNLYRNDGDGFFTDLVYSSGLGLNRTYMGWGVGFMDFDNDGWLDIFMVNGHIYPELEPKLPDQPYRQSRILYRNLGQGRFEDVSARAGPGVTQSFSGRGLSIGDFDNDGDVDIFINNMNEVPSLLLNEGGNAKSFLSIKTVGVSSNRDGIGARVAVTVGGFTQFAEVRSGSSFMSQNDLRLHFGLNDATRVDRIEILWPSGKKDEIRGVSCNQFVTAVEGQGIASKERYQAKPVQ